MGLAPSMSLNAQRPQNTHGISSDPTTLHYMASPSILSINTLTQPFNPPTPPSPLLSHAS